MTDGGRRVARGDGSSWLDEIGEGDGSRNGGFLRSAREARAGNFSRRPFTDPIVLNTFFLGSDFFLNRRIEISKLAAPFPRIAPVRLFRRSIHDFFGLNTEPMNRAIGGSHLYPVRHAKKVEQNALFGRKKYIQLNSRIETCR